MTAGCKLLQPWLAFALLEKFLAIQECILLGHTSDGQPKLLQLLTPLSFASCTRSMLALQVPARSMQQSSLPVLMLAQRGGSG